MTDWPEEISPGCLFLVVRLGGTEVGKQRKYEKNKREPDIDSFDELFPPIKL